MTDIPVFTAADGIATLILHEVPARGEGYILVRAVFGALPGLLDECAAFCRSIGARSVYASGEGDFSVYPVYASLMERKRRFAALPEAPGLEVVPVTEQTAWHWAEEYNRRFAAVPSAQSCGFAETRRLAQQGEAFFVLQEGTPVGLGRVRGTSLLALASLRPGMGKETLLALVRHCGLSEVTLTCAVENRQAMALYDRLGFSRGAIFQRWYSLL